MTNLTSVGLTSGLGSSGTGTISTLDNLIGTAGTASAQVQTVQGVASMTPIQVSQSTAASLNTTTVLAAGSAIVGSVKTTDGTNTAAVKAASTAPIATDPALVVSISPNSVNSNGRKIPANSAPVVLNSQVYATVAASQTAQGLGATGAIGDYLDGILVIPGTTSPGVVTILDSSTSINIFAGGATSVASLVPFFIPVGAISANGQWKVTTGANVTAIAVGNFT